MSAGFFPFRCSVMMLLFINTVQRLPSTAGFSEENAASAISFTGICSEDAKFSRKEPHPEEQASLDHDVSDDAVIQPDGFHILSADIQNKGGVGYIFLCRPGMGHRLHNMTFQIKGFCK